MANIDEWANWLRRITRDVQDLLFAREVYRTVGEMISANPQLQRPSHFYDYLARTYATHIAMGIRRQVDERRDTISMRRLLREIANSPTCLSRARYMALCVKGKETSAHLVHNEARAAKEFEDRNGVGASFFNADRARQDEQQLVALAGHVKTHVDTTLAHAGKEQPEHPATFEDLNTVLDELAGLIASYRLELEAVMFKPEPVLQGDWSSIFEVPWIDDGDKS